MSYFLLILALTCELFLPILTWRLGIPSSFRLISQMAIAGLLVIGYMRLFRRNWRVAIMILILLAMILCVAVMLGQPFAIALLGWWLMFKYPFIGLAFILEPKWPAGMGGFIRRVCITIAGMELFVQILQYIGGEIPGDNLAGTFGMHGTGHLAIFLMIVVALSLGRWIATNKSFQLSAILILGAASSLLGEMKIYFMGVAIMSVLALLICVVKDAKRSVIINFIGLLSLILIFFPLAYDAVFQEAKFSDYLNLSSAGEYLDTVSTDEYGNEDVGRNYMLAHVWTEASKDPLRLLLGQGLGARTESKTLGLSGTALKRGEFRNISGNSLVVFLGETGLIGLLCLLVFIASTARALWKSIKSDFSLENASLKYGVILYTLVLPVWLWYGPFWTSPIPMLIYWTIFGYTLRDDSQMQFCRNLIGASRLAYAGFAVDGTRNNCNINH